MTLGNALVSSVAAARPRMRRPWAGSAASIRTTTLGDGPLVKTTEVRSKTCWPGYLCSTCRQSYHHEEHAHQLPEPRGESDGLQRPQNLHRPMSPGQCRWTPMAHELGSATVGQKDPTEPDQPKAQCHWSAGGCR